MIGETISILLSHYGSSEMHPALRAGQARDWLDDLREFPSSIVKEAVKSWRQGPEAAKGFRPQPGNIRAVCLDMHAAAQRRMQIGQHSDKADEQRNRRIQRLLAFRRWEPEWGAYPSQWEIDEVADQRQRHQLDATPERKILSAEQQANVDALKSQLGALVKPRRMPGEARALAPFDLPAEDDPAVQDALRRMNER